MSLVSEREHLLLRAALCSDPQAAISSWKSWSSQIELENAPYPELRLLTAVYANLTEIAPDFSLPAKLRGKARATFFKNHLLAREALPTIEAMNAHGPVLISKGLGMCVRFNAWSSRIMGDADIHVPLTSFESSVRVLRDHGWNPQYGMTWESLVHRTALRRSSWNFQKGQGFLDLHWRPQPETDREDIIQGMWNGAEIHKCFGHDVCLQSPEHALITTLGHGFRYGTQGDKIQTILDVSALLQQCNRALLEPLIDAFKLQGEFETVLSMLKEAGAASAIVGFEDLMATAGMPVSSIAEKEQNTPSVGWQAKPEKALLRHPVMYRFWENSGRHQRLERAMLQGLGPFSKPFAWSGVFADDYDLRDCQVMDTIAGPGWSWPEPEHSCFWADRADARLLVPLGSADSYLVALTLGEHRVHSPNPRVNVFANGHFLTTMDLRRNILSSQYCFLISRTILHGPWVELSMRPSPYKASRTIDPQTYQLSRSVPIARLQLFGSKDLDLLLSGRILSPLHRRIQRGDEPEASKFERIRARIQSSGYRSSKELPVDFDPVFYVLNYPDLFEHEVDPYEHFLTSGRTENRQWRDRLR